MSDFFTNFAAENISMNRLQKILSAVSKFPMLIWMVYVVAAVGAGKSILGWPDWIGIVCFGLMLICVVLEIFPCGYNKQII